METLLIVLHVVVCLFLVAIVLLQHGKGADIGATFGGSSQSLFGSEGPLPLLNKITTAAAVIFMLTSVALAYISSHTGTESVMSDLNKPEPVQQTTQPPAEKKQAPAPTTQQPSQAEPVKPEPASDTMAKEQAKASATKAEAPPAAAPAAGEKKENKQ